MAAAAPLHTILACLRDAGRPVSPAEIRTATQLPLPVITRTLQMRAHGAARDVEREVDRNGAITYRYIGGNSATTPERTTEFRSLYRRIAEHLRNPMHLAKLSKLVQRQPDEVRRALQVFVDGGHINAKEVMGDIVYQPVGDLESIAPDLPEPEGDPVSLSSRLPRRGDAAWLDAIRERLGDDAAPRLADVRHQRDQTDQLIDALVAEVEFWRATARRLLEEADRHRD